MMKAVERFKKLDFSVSESIEKLKVKELRFDKMRHKDSLLRLRERIKDAKRI